MTQGGGVGLKHVRLKNIPLAIGIDRESYSGGLAWERSASWSAEVSDFQADRDGVNFSIGAIVGINVRHLERLINLVIPCAF